LNGTAVPGSPFAVEAKEKNEGEDGGSKLKAILGQENRVTVQAKSSGKPKRLGGDPMVARFVVNQASASSFLIFL